MQDYALYKLSRRGFKKKDSDYIETTLSVKNAKNYWVENAIDKSTQKWDFAYSVSMLFGTLFPLRRRRWVSGVAFRLCLCWFKGAEHDFS